MNLQSQLLLAGLVAAQGIPASMSAQESNASPENLRQQLHDLDQKVRVLERKQEIDKEAAAEKAKTTSSVSIGPGGLQVATADTNFVLKVRGYVQVDGRAYVDDYTAGKVNDTFLIRRARPIFEGTLYKTFDYRVMLDLGTGVTSAAGNNAFLQDAYVTAKLLPEFQIQAGKFKEPVGLERLQSGANLLFVERAYPTQLVPNRDVGVQVQGDIAGGLISYAAGVFNGVANGGSDDIETGDDDKDVAGRVFAQPFKKAGIDGLQGLGLGLAGSIGNQEGALRTFASPGQQRFFGYRTGVGTNATTANVIADGQHWRLSPQGYYYNGPFGLFGEYVISDQDVRRDAGGRTFQAAHNTAWQVAVSYFVTGEANSFKAVAPKRPFSLRDSGWGALELTARVQQLDVDDDLFPLFANPASSATEATSWGVGANWHLNRNVKLSLNYEQTDFKGASASEFLAKGEKVVLGRVQFSF